MVLRMGRGMGSDESGGRTRRTGAPRSVTAREGVTMATKAGCRALSLEGGEIREGAPADLALFDLDAPGLVPLGDPVAALAYSGAALRAEAVLVGGELVWNGGRSTKIDMDRAYAAARETCKRLGM